MHPAWIAGFQGSARTGAFPRNKAQTPLPQITRRSQQCNPHPLAFWPCSAMCAAPCCMCAGCVVITCASQPPGHSTRGIALSRPETRMCSQRGRVRPLRTYVVWWCLGHSCAPWRLPAPPCGPGCLPCAAGGVLLRRTIRVSGDGCNPRFRMIMELSTKPQVRALKIFSRRGVVRVRNVRV